MAQNPTTPVLIRAFTKLFPGMPTAHTVVKASASKQAANTFGVQQPKTWAKVGTSITYRYPYDAEAVVGADQTSNLNAVDSRTVTFSLFDGGQPTSVAWAYTANDAALFLDSPENRKDTFVEDYMRNLSAKVESKFINAISNYAPNCFGTQGTLLNDPSVVLEANAYLNDIANNLQDDRFGLITSMAQAGMINGEAAYFNPTNVISKQFEKGMIADAQGVAYKVVPLLPTFTMGTATFTTAHVQGQPDFSATVNGTTVSLPVEGLGAGTVTAGTPFTIAGVWDIIPGSYDRAGHLKKFTVTAATTSSSSEATFTITPAIITDGPYRNVSTDEVDNVIPLDAAITLQAGLAPSEVSRPNILMQLEGVVGTTVKLSPPTGNGVLEGSNEKFSDGIWMSLVGSFAAGTFTETWRWNISSGCKVVRPELVCRLFDGIGTIGA